MARPGAITAELAIVGGGLSGLTLGIACAGAGIDTVVIDRDDPARMMAVPFDGRTTAISFGSRQVLAAMGAWKLLAPDTEPILEIRVADQDSPHFLHYDHRALGTAPLGFIIENRKLRGGLFARAQELPPLRLLAPVAVTDTERDENGACVGLADGRTIRTALVVAADGRNSPTRGQAGIASHSAPYRQTAIVATVRHEAPHRGVAVEHFRASGPFATLPMQGNRSSIVWTESAEGAKRIAALGRAAFTRALARRFGDHLGAIEVEGNWWTYPLTLTHARALTATRLALVGDAAHAIHPIAGQGWNLGVRDIAALAELVVDASRLGLDIGAPSLLAQYARWRRFDNMVLTAVTDGLTRLFSNDVAPVVWARDIGLGAVQRAPRLKKFFMRHAMGTVGDMPRLMRGESL